VVQRLQGFRFIPPDGGGKDLFAALLGDQGSGSIPEGEPKWSFDVTAGRKATRPSTSSPSRNNRCSPEKSPGSRAFFMGCGKGGVEVARSERPFLDRTGRFIILPSMDKRKRGGTGQQLVERWNAAASRLATLRQPCRPRLRKRRCSAHEERVLKAKAGPGELEAVRKQVRASRWSSAPESATRKAQASLSAAPAPSATRRCGSRIGRPSRRDASRFRDTSEASPASRLGELVDRPEGRLPRARRRRCIGLAPYRDFIGIGRRLRFTIRPWGLLNCPVCRIP